MFKRFFNIAIFSILFFQSLESSAQPIVKTINIQPGYLNPTFYIEADYPSGTRPLYGGASIGMSIVGAGGSSIVATPDQPGENQQPLPTLQNGKFITYSPGTKNLYGGKFNINPGLVAGDGTLNINLSLFSFYTNPDGSQPACTMRKVYKLHIGNTLAADEEPSFTPVQSNCTKGNVEYPTNFRLIAGNPPPYVAPKTPTIAIAPTATRTVQPTATSTTAPTASPTIGSICPPGMNCVPTPNVCASLNKIKNDTQALYDCVCNNKCQ